MYNNRVFFLLISHLSLAFSISSQSLSISGTIQDENGVGVPFATTVLKTTLDSSMVKAIITEENGHFSFDFLNNSDYFIEVSYLGMSDYTSSVIKLKDQNIILDNIVLFENAAQIDEVIVTANRAIIEVKADRTIFNVQGTINATGENGLNLLRKAPGVLVDNNNNISVLGRAGVLLYVDGKRIPLSGDDLTNYLESLSSDQIDKIDIITNPGSKYEAQGNAGIIDIRLKKDKNIGSNGSVSTTYNQGRYGQGNVNANGNYRNKLFNTFGGVGYNLGSRWNSMLFDTYQNCIRLDESNLSVTDYQGLNGRFGTDFFISKNSTLGFLVGAQYNQSDRTSNNRNIISNQITPLTIDSILLAPNTLASSREQATFNVNYAFQSGKNRLNIDADYGTFVNDAENFQPNFYYDAGQNNITSQNITSYDTPVKINIATAKIDYETEWYGGNLGIGSKISNVSTDNTFLFYNNSDLSRIRNDQRSNLFKYYENVYAGYVNYGRLLVKHWNTSVGLRVERTDAMGDLSAFLPELEEDPVEFNYINYFPSAGLTYQKNPQHIYSLNFGRRINRPDYNVLNPFREQLSELSYSKGNKLLQPEIVNNIEIGYTLNYKYSFKLSYSNTANQITRLIGPDELDPRASFISWDNLASQKLYNLNASVPLDITKWWNSYTNISVSYIDNQADYGDGRVVDVQAGSYNIFQQNTFSLGKKWKGEISGWYSGPGVWGGVFLYDPSYSLNLGIQRKFLNDKMNVRLIVSDITYQTGWSGVAQFNGQIGYGAGNWDSRRATLSISYDLGNKSIKSRKRNTGIETESKRVGGE